MTAADQPWVARPEPTATTSGQRGLSGVSIIISELPTDSDSDVPDLKDPGRLAADSGSHRPTQLGQHHLPAIFANLASHAAIPPAQPIAPVPYHNSNSPGLDELPSNTVCKGVPNSQRFVNPMSKLPRSELEWSSLTKSVARSVFYRLEMLDPVDKGWAKTILQRIEKGAERDNHHAKFPCFLVQRGENSRSPFQVQVGGTRMVAQKAIFVAFHRLTPTAAAGREQVKQKCMHPDDTWWCFEPSHLFRWDRRQFAPGVTRHGIPNPPHAMLPVCSPGRGRSASKSPPGWEDWATFDARTLPTRCHPVPLKPGGSYVGSPPSKNNPTPIPQPPRIRANTAQRPKQKHVHKLRAASTPEHWKSGQVYQWPLVAETTVDVAADNAQRPLQQQHGEHPPTVPRASQVPYHPSHPSEGQQHIRQQQQQHLDGQRRHSHLQMQMQQQLHLQQVQQQQQYQLQQHYMQQQQQQQYLQQQHAVAAHNAQHTTHLRQMEMARNQQMLITAQLAAQLAAQSQVLEQQQQARQRHDQSEGLETVVTQRTQQLMDRRDRAMHARQKSLHARQKSMLSKAMPTVLGVAPRNDESYVFDSSMPTLPATPGMMSMPGMLGMPAVQPMYAQGMPPDPGMHNVAVHTPPGAAQAVYSQVAVHAPPGTAQAMISDRAVDVAPQARARALVVARPSKRPRLVEVTDADNGRTFAADAGAAGPLPQRQKGAPARPAAASDAAVAAVQLPADLCESTTLTPLQLNGVRQLCIEVHGWSPRELLLFCSAIKKVGDGTVGIAGAAAMIAADPLCNKTQSEATSWATQWRRTNPPILDWIASGGGRAIRVKDECVADRDSNEHDSGDANDDGAVRRAINSSTILVPDLGPCPTACALDPGDFGN